MLISTSIKKKFNEISKNYHQNIPFGEMFEILEENGIIAVQEDGCKWQGFLCGSIGRCSIDLKYNEKILNKRLQLSWYKMPSGRFEVTAYIM